MIPALPDQVYSFIRQLRPRNALGAVMATGIGYLSSDTPPDIRSVSQLFIVIFCLHTAATLWNDLADEATDRANNRHSGLLDGVVSATSLRYTASICVVASLVVSCLLPRPLPALGLAICFVCLSLAYSASPFALMRRPVASIATLGLCTGALPVLFGALSFGSATSIVYWLCAAWGLQRVSLNLLKDFKDRPGDAATGKRTFLIHFGKRATINASHGTAMLSYVLMVLTLVNAHPILSGILAGAGLAMLGYRIYCLRAASNTQLGRSFNTILTLQNVYEGGIIVWLLILSIV